MHVYIFFVLFCIFELNFNCNLKYEIFSIYFFILGFVLFFFFLVVVSFVVVVIIFLIQRTTNFIYFKIKQSNLIRFYVK